MKLATQRQTQYRRLLLLCRQSLTPLICDTDRLDVNNALGVEIYLLYWQHFVEICNPNCTAKLAHRAAPGSVISDVVILEYDIVPQAMRLCRLCTEGGVRLILIQQGNNSFSRYPCKCSGILIFPRRCYRRPSCALQVCNFF